MIALFNHDTDPDADTKLIRYLRTGHLDRSAVATPQDVGQPGQAPVTATAPTTTAPQAASVAQLLHQNAQLLRQVRANQARIERLLKQRAP